MVYLYFTLNWYCITLNFVLMKKPILSLTFSLFAILFIGCGTDNCVSCSKQLPNSTADIEICESGSDVTVKETINKIVTNTTVTNTSVESYRKVVEATGYTCK